MLHRVSLALLLALWCCTTLAAQTTSTLSAETGNNTSVAGPFDTTSGNASPANVSKLPTRSLLYSGATTKIYAHLMPWFCLPASAGKCGGHVTTGYESNDAAQVDRQVTDMLSRGIDGAIVDWYGPHKTHHNDVTIKLMQQAESRVDAAGNPLFEFAITEDQGALKDCRDNGWASCDCWPAGSSNCTVTTQLVSDLNYAFNTFYPSPAYMRRGGRPVVFFFIDETQYPNIDWNWARSNLQGNPLLVFRNSGGFMHSQSNGAFSWLSTSGATASDPASLAYLNNFYDTAKTRGGSPQVFGSSYKGFDDSLAGWAPSPPREIAQHCGQTWLDSWAEANRNYSSANQLANLQIVTWNDYDEGTEIESGIDNCLSISAAVSGSDLTWTLSGTGEDNTIDRYRIWSSPASDGQNLTLRHEAMGGSARSVALSALNLPDGSYKLYVQAVGKPSIRNHMSGAVDYIQGATDPVTVSAPAASSTVQSQVHVVATENTSRNATSMQIYLDSTKVLTQDNTDSLDTYIDAGCGQHKLTVKAWYADGTNNPASFFFDVSRANLVSTPTAGSTVSSPVQVVSTSCSDFPVTATQIYLDDVLKAETSTSTLNQSIAMSAGPHCIVGKGWDSAGHSFRTTRICFTVQ